MLRSPRSDSIAAEGMDILWFTPNKPENISVGRSRIATHLRDMGYEVTLRGTTPSKVTRALSERGDYEVILGTTRAGAFAGMLISEINRIPLIVDHVDPIEQFRNTHSFWVSELVFRAENLIFSRASKTLFVYEEERDRVELHAPESTKTNLGVDYERFADPDEQTLSRGRDILSDNLEAPIAIYVGGLEPIYNIHSLLEAGKKLRKGSLIIFGSGSLEAIVKQVAQSSSTVHFLGTISHDLIPGVLAHCDVGLSLVDDPHTLKVLEYGAAGLSVVQLDGRVRGHFGPRLIYTENNPASIRRAIQEAWHRNDSSLRSFVRQFDWKDIATTYSKAIERVI